MAERERAAMADVAIAVPGGQVHVWYRPALDGSPTTVLIHGLSGNSRWWTRVIEHLPDDLGLVAMDIRGRGLSVDAPPPFDLATVADDIARALDHFDVARATVAGYSMGGWVAALFGVTHPGRVDRLVLVDGGFPIPAPEGSHPDEMIEALVGASLQRLEMVFDDSEDFFTYWRTHPGLAPYWDDAMRDTLGHELVERNGRKVVRANPEAIRVGAEEIVLPGRANEAGWLLRVPTLLIVVERGTVDQPGGMIPLQVAEGAAGHVDDLTFEYMADLNHYTLLIGSGASKVAAAIATTR